MDSGSAVNLIHYSLLGNEQLEKTDVELIGAEGSSLEVLGIREKEITINNAQRMVRFFVCKRTNHSVS